MSQTQQDQPGAQPPAAANPMLPYDRLGRASEITTVPPENSLSLYLNPVLFEQGMRAAGVLATSGILPRHYQDNQSACFLLLAMSSALQMNPIMLAQKSYIVHGKFGFESQAMIALANNSGAFATPLDWEYSGDGENRAVVCYTTRKSNGAKITAECSVVMAKAFGWWGKNDSLWPKMTDQMLAYRSAAFLMRRYAPEVLLGLNTVDELQDMGPSFDAEYTAVTGSVAPGLYDTAPFNAAIEEQGIAADDTHLAAFIKQIADQNRISPDRVKVEAAGDITNFIGTFKAWVEKQQAKAEPAPKPEKKPAAKAKPEPQPEPDKNPFAGDMVQCPNNDRMVDAVDCAGKSCRNRCPAFD